MADCASVATREASFPDPPPNPITMAKCLEMLPTTDRQHFGMQNPLCFIAQNGCGQYPPTFSAMGLTEVPACLTHGMRSTKQFVSRGTTVPLSSAKDTCPQWLGASNANNTFLKTTTHTRKYQQAYLLSPGGKPQSGSTGWPHQKHRGTSEFLKKASVLCEQNSGNPSPPLSFQTSHLSQFQWEQLRSGPLSLSSRPPSPLIHTFSKGPTPRSCKGLRARASHARIHSYIHTCVQSSAENLRVKSGCVERAVHRFSLAGYRTHPSLWLLRGAFGVC